MQFSDILRAVDWTPAVALFGGRALLLLAVCVAVIAWMTVRELRKK